MALPLPTLNELGTPRLWAEIDLEAIKYNVRVLRRYIAPSQFTAVVKANAYGLGAVPIAKAALEAGASGLAVASFEEGHELRRAGIGGRILVLGYVSPDLAGAAVEAELTLTVNTPDLAQALSRAVQNRRRTFPLPVHLKLDTGLHRYGLEPDQALEMCKIISGLPGLALQGLYTHFASGDEADPSFVLEQKRRFDHTRDLLEANGFYFPQQHLSNSASAITVKEARSDFVRFGLALHGYHATPEVEAEARKAGLFLKPALTVKSTVVRLSTLPAGETVGYNRTYKASEPRQVALIPVGYADGYRRSLSNKGQVLINGKRAPVLGRVSMDQIVVDVTDHQGLQEGDEVVLIGAQGDDAVSLEEVAAWCDTITHEILTGLGRRVKRVYLG
ncbi:MAG: Alanine racemase [Chloroflexi bacterium]|jgi:alanine racemase|nr:Alanine racemase [Chloroflexota bacterium]